MDRMVGEGSGQWLSYDAATAVRLSASSTAPLSKDAVAMRAQLRASLTDYTRRLAADGLPAERVLVMVKAAVRGALPPRGDPDRASELMADVVRWMIAAYYHDA